MHDATRSGPLSKPKPYRPLFGPAQQQLFSRKQNFPFLLFTFRFKFPGSQRTGAKRTKMEENTTTAAASTSATTTTDSDSIILETLRSRGWCLGDIDQLKAIIMIQSALADDMSTVVDSVESELTNMDLKSFGAKSLPDPTLPRKPSHILGPKVLQATRFFSFFFLGLFSWKPNRT